MKYLELKPLEYRFIYSYSIHGEDAFVDMRVEPLHPLEIGSNYIFCSRELWEKEYKGTRKLVTCNLALHLLEESIEPQINIGEVTFWKEEFKDGVLVDVPRIFISAYLPREGLRQVTNNIKDLAQLVISAKFDGLEDAFYDPHLFWGINDYKTEYEDRFKAPLNNISINLRSPGYWTELCKAY